MKDKIIFIVLALILALCIISSINEPKEEILKQEEIKETLDIEKTDYYEKYNISNIELSNDVNYLLYFHQQNCGGCLDTNKVIDKYITLGYENVIPLYFVSLNELPDLFDEYNIEETPTLFYSNDGEAVYYTGLEEIKPFLDKIVETANK